MEQKIIRDLNMGANLRTLRYRSGLSQENLCVELQRRGCDIGRTTYAKYESGELNIRASVIVALRKIYNCSYDDFSRDLNNKNRLSRSVHILCLMRQPFHFVFYRAI